MKFHAQALLLNCRVSYTRKSYAARYLLEGNNEFKVTL